MGPIFPLQKWLPFHLPLGAYFIYSVVILQIEIVQASQKEIGWRRYIVT